MVVTWEEIYKIVALLVDIGIFVCAVIEVVPKRRKKRRRHKKKK